MRVCAHLHMPYWRVERSSKLWLDDRRLLHCGDGRWQRDYAQLHSDIVAGEAGPRYLLAEGQNGTPRIRQPVSTPKCHTHCSAHTSGNMTEIVVRCTT